MGATFTVGAFSFDSFRDSLPIVSLERCVDVMGVVTNPNQQPQTNASLANAVFFVIYNLLSSVIILMLFVRWAASISIVTFHLRADGLFLSF